jgi:hypothetical protein
MLNNIVRIMSEKNASNAGNYDGFGQHKKIVPDEMIRVPKRFATELEKRDYISSYKIANRDARREYAE